MAKKNLASLMNGIMGEEPKEETLVSQTPEVKEATEITPEMHDELAARRKQNSGRPRKDAETAKADEMRATFIVNPEALRKIKYISLVDARMQKEIIADALDRYITEWEAENGKIRLPKKK